ncbi:MAG: cystathionine gamma-synthase [Planctomycetes bacterium]|nr:cystathionine gamma-synthase [Planctomycetota bacterium]
MTHALIEPSLPEAAFATRAIHAGPGPDEATGAVLTPVHQSTTYRQDGVGRDRGYTYSRCGNPTVAALEERLGQLEGVGPAIVTSTGMAATTTLFLSELCAGDRVVLGDVVYGGTTRVLQQILARFGVRADFVDTSDLAAVRRVLIQPAKLVFVETPANPTLKLTDLAAVAELAHAAGALFVVDNTFLTPALQDCFELGADVVVYSTTKHIEGHNSTVGGALLARDPQLADRLRFVRNTTGCSQAPWEAWLTLRGLKTLNLRLQQHSAHALEVAQWLQAQPEVARVWYPGLKSHPQFALAQRQQKGGGGLLAFELAGGTPAALRFLESLQLVTLAENLGAVESLVTHPATMTHGTVPAEQRHAAGISDGLIRLSVGLEEPRDIIADLEKALAECAGGVLA